MKTGENSLVQTAVRWDEEFTIRISDEDLCINGTIWAIDSNTREEQKLGKFELKATALGQTSQTVSLPVYAETS